MRKLGFFCIIICLALSASAKTVRVGVIANKPPISFFSDGQPKGIAVDIWKEVAHQNNWDSEFIPLNAHLLKLTHELDRNKYDVLVGPVPLEYKYVDTVVFTHPFFLNKIGLLVRDSKISFLEVIRSQFGRNILIFIMSFILLFIIFVHLFWYFERGKSDAFKESYREGIKESIWTATTTFLRDLIYNPKSGKARIIISIWIIVSIIFTAAFTAVLTSSLTVTLTHRHKVFDSVGDLYNEKIGAVKETDNVLIGQRVGAQLTLPDDTAQAIRLLIDGEINGIITDIFIAQWYLRTHPNLQIRLSKLIIANDAYVFALNKKSKLLRFINRELTRLQDNGFTKKICMRYISEHTHSCEF